MELFLRRKIFFTTCTVGILYVSNDITLATLEPGENIPGKELVPYGNYDLVPYTSPTHGPTWCLHNPLLHVYAGFGKYAPPPTMATHTFIELHAGNYTRDNEACILPGQEWSGTPWVERSRSAMTQLFKALEWGSLGHTLLVRESPDRVEANGKPMIDRAELGLPW